MPFRTCFFFHIAPTTSQFELVEVDKPLKDWLTPFKDRFSHFDASSDVNSLVLSTPISGFSWGEIVEIEEQPSDKADKFLLAIKTKKRFGLPDFGKNYRNLVKAKDVISS